MICAYCNEEHSMNKHHRDRRPYKQRIAMFRIRANDLGKDFELSKEMLDEVDLICQQYAKNAELL